MTDFRKLTLQIGNLGLVQVPLWLTGFEPLKPLSQLPHCRVVVSLPLSNRLQLLRDLIGLKLLKPQEISLQLHFHRICDVCPEAHNTLVGFLCAYLAVGLQLAEGD